MSVVVEALCYEWESVIFWTIVPKTVVNTILLGNTAVLYLVLLTADIKEFCTMMITLFWDITLDVR
jgi:hypothetical protein